MPPTHARCVFCIDGGLSLSAQLPSVTIANPSSREHRLAICTATDYLCNLRVCTLYPICDRASGESPPSLPHAGFFPLFVTEVTAADYRLPFPERIAILVAGHPGHDRETLRSFAILYDVRRFYIVYI